MAAELPTGDTPYERTLSASGEAGHRAPVRRGRGRIAARVAVAPAIALAVALCVGAFGSAGRPATVRGQGVPTATPLALAPPPSAAVAIAGRWSVTRSWLRRCPGCSFPVVRTATWDITVVSDTVRVARGPRGVIMPDGMGGALLHLEGLEAMAGSTLRFYYSTLRVAPDGLSFEGGFSGSERLANPCGSTPPTVTCFANAGWLRATRIDATPGPRAPTPAGPPTAGAPTAAATGSPTVAQTPLPSATPTEAATPSPAPVGPTATATSAPSATRAAPTATATATQTPPIPWAAWLPILSPAGRR